MSVPSCLFKWSLFCLCKAQVNLSLYNNSSYGNKTVDMFFQAYRGQISRWKRSAAVRRRKNAKCMSRPIWEIEYACCDQRAFDLPIKILMKREARGVDMHEKPRKPTDVIDWFSGIVAPCNLRTFVCACVCAHSCVSMYIPTSLSIDSRGNRSTSMLSDAN